MRLLVKMDTPLSTTATILTALLSSLLIISELIGWSRLPCNSISEWSICHLSHYIKIPWYQSRHVHRAVQATAETCPHHATQAPQSL